MTSILAFLLAAGCTYADMVTLKNGDHVTGTLVSVKGGTLQLKSDKLGDLSIPVANVASYSSETPMALIIKGREPIEGTLSLTPAGVWQVKANGQTQSFPAAQVDTIMPDADYQKLVATNPAPWQAWKGNTSLGYSVQTGNQHTTTLVAALNANRERPATPIFIRHWRTDFSFTTLLSHAEQDASTVTSHVLTANLEQNYLLSADNFLFVLAQANHISTQQLYLQQTYGGGYGRYLVKTPRTAFNIIVAPTYVQEKFFDGLLTRTTQLLIGETLGAQLTKKLRVDHYLQFYPDLKNTGQYRLNTSTIATIKLSNKFAVNASLLDFYLSNPPPPAPGGPGATKNNVTFSTGITYSF